MFTHNVRRQSKRLYTFAKVVNNFVDRCPLQV